MGSITPFPRHAAVTIALLVLAGGWGAVEPAQADDDSASYEAIGVKDLRLDGRLQRPVTLVGTSLYVAEVLQRISEQTGVTMVADEASGASDPRMLVSLKAEPAWRVMSCMERLFSYRSAPWRWERRGSAGSGSYRLVQTRSAQLLGGKLTAETQEAFERDFAERLAASHRSESEWVERLSDSKPVQIEERSGWGVQVFAACLSPEDQRAVLRGETDAVVPVEKLPPIGRRLVEDLYREMRPWIDTPWAGRVPAPMPTEMKAYRAWHAYDAAPSLVLEFGDMGGYSYVGGLPLKRSVQRHLAEQWVGEGDVQHDEVREAQVIPPGRISDETAELIGLERDCMELSELSGLPVMGRVRRVRFGYSRVSRVGMSVGGYLKKLWEPPTAIHKWHEGILLVSCLDWYWFPEEVHRVPWSVVRGVREACASNSGLIPLGTLLDLYRDLTIEQVDALKTVWPPAGSIESSYDVMRYVARSERLRRRLCDEGVVVLRGAEAATVGARMRAELQPTAPVVDRIEIRARELKEGEERVLDIDMQLLDASGRFICGVHPTFRPGAP